MTRVELVPTQAEDLPHVFGEPLPCRIKGITGKRGDEVLGIGGLIFLPSGTVAAFLAIKDEARKYPIALHKAALRTLAEAKAMGIQRITAIADGEIDRAAPWLERLGFKRITIDNGHEVFEWQTP